jgi:osmoprotectant transport system ATP-binding protein
MTSDTVAIRFSSVGYTVGGTVILDSIELEVVRGEILILLGESGCGKTTTLKLINRLIDPTSGEISVEDKNTRDWDPIELRRRIGYVLQEAGLFPHYTVEQNVGVVMELLGVDPVSVRHRVEETLELVRLDPVKFASRFPHELSGGQRQRVGVARAIAAGPSIILLDEPFGALDVITRTEIQREFARLVRELGKTAVFVTHDLHEAMILGSRIALMEKGRIVFLGTPDEFASSEVPLARAFLETIER